MRAEGTHRTYRQIIAETCEGTGVTPADIMSASRIARVVEVRHRIMRAMRRETKLSLSQIGARLGGKDHSTVHNALRKSDRPLDKMPAVAASRKCSRDRLVRLALAYQPPRPLTPAAPLPAAPPSPEPAIAAPADPDEFTPLQRRCRIATDDLLILFGPALYAGQNVASRAVMAAPPFEPPALHQVLQDGPRQGSNTFQQNLLSMAKRNHGAVQCSRNRVLENQT